MSDVDESTNRLRHYEIGVLHTMSEYLLGLRVYVTAYVTPRNYGAAVSSTNPFPFEGNPKKKINKVIYGQLRHKKILNKPRNVSTPNEYLKVKKLTNRNVTSEGDQTIRGETILFINYFFIFVNPFFYWTLTIHLLR